MTDRIVRCGVCRCHMFEYQTCGQCDTPWFKQPHVLDSGTVAVPRSLFNRVLADYAKVASGRSLCFGDSVAMYNELSLLRNRK